MYKIKFHKKVADDVSKINKVKLSFIKKVIADKLSTDPIYFSKQLHAGLKHFRSLRVSEYRVVYMIIKNKVHILAIDHRKEIYDKALKRLF